MVTVDRSTLSGTTGNWGGPSNSPHKRLGALIAKVFQSRIEGLGHLAPPRLVNGDAAEFATPIPQPRPSRNRPDLSLADPPGRNGGCGMRLCERDKRASTNLASLWHVTHDARHAVEVGVIAGQLGQAVGLHECDG